MGEHEEFKLQYIALSEVDMSIANKEREFDLLNITVKEGCITLTWQYKYNIELTRCNTPEKILGWMNHLSSKTWVTKRRLMLFAAVAFKEIGIEVNRRIDLT